jgi:hypothetical protein
LPLPVGFTKRYGSRRKHCELCGADDDFFFKSHNRERLRWMISLGAVRHLKIDDVVARQGPIKNLSLVATIATSVLFEFLNDVLC